MTRVASLTAGTALVALLERVYVNLFFLRASAIGRWLLLVLLLSSCLGWAQTLPQGAPPSQAPGGRVSIGDD